MRAVVIDDGALTWSERPDPEPGRGELLVAVRAAGVNGADLLQRRGLYPPPPGAPADIPGMEFAGEVVGVGAGVVHHGLGDRVFGIVGGGGQAELVTVDQEVALAVPDGIDWPEAGGFPEVFFTAYDALVAQAGLAAGERVLVTGAAGGVGTAGVQLAAAAGAHVVASARSADADAALRGLGAAEVVRPDGAADAGPYDVVLELVGASSLAPVIRSLATGARVVVIGVGGGGATLELNLLELMGRRARLGGSTLRNRSTAEKAELARAVHDRVVPLLATGKVRVPVAATFPLARATEAYERFAAGGKVGKVVLVGG